MRVIKTVFVALVSSLWTLQAPPAFSQQVEPGRWIPLPYFRSGNWWLPVDVAKPQKLQASLVALAGRDCYLFADSPSSVSLVRHTGKKILSAGQIKPLDARHFAFSKGTHQFGIVRNDGEVLPDSPKDSQTMWDRSEEYGRRAQPAAPALPPDTSLTTSGWAVSSNSQPQAFPLALDYNEKLGLLCVVQDVGKYRKGSELRVWDVRSRNCLWTRRLKGSPEGPVSVRVLDNASVFVNGGYGKYNSCYLRVYDIDTRQMTFERNTAGTNEMGRLRMAPLPDGRRVLSIPSLMAPSSGARAPDATKGVHLFDISSQTERLLLPSHEVASVHALGDGRTALVGTMQGEVLRLDVDDGSHAVLGALAEEVITALAASDDHSTWAAGTREGAVIRGALSGAVDATLPALDGEVTGLAFLRGATSKLAIRVAGAGMSGFYKGYSVATSKHAAGVIWDMVTGERQPLPPGAGVCALNGSILGINLADGTGTVLYDAATGGMSEPLGSLAPSLLERRATTGEGLDKPSSLRTNRDGSQIFIQGKLFDFRTMRFEPMNKSRALSEPIMEAARMRLKSPRPVENDEDHNILEQAGADAKTDELLDLLLLGPSKRPTRVLLYPDPNTVAAFYGLSQSGKVAAIFSQWKGSGDLRLVDLERYRVMSQPNQGNLTENLQKMNFLGWVKPLDDEGHRVLAIHSNAGMVDLLDYAGGRTISRVHFGGAAAAACCAVEARRLFIATDDAAIHCVTWDDAGHLRPVGRLDLGMHDTWALAQPNGVFMSSGSERLMALAGNGRALPLDTGAAAFHRPHDVARAFGALPELVALLERAYVRRCQRDGLNLTQGQQNDVKDLPQAAIRDRLKLQLAVREAAFSLTAEASASGSPLQKLLVVINGVPLHTWKPELPADLKAWSGEIPLTLAPGANKIQISVVDTQGRESLRETVVVWHIAPPAPPVLHLVAVGVSDYKDNRLDLGAASKDARDLAQFLAQRQGRGHREVRSLVITDKQAMRESILQARDFLRASKEGDQVVVFVAGHGFVDQEGLRYWFGTHDIDIEAVDNRGVSYEELESLFDGVAARQRLLLMDTCFAGEVDRDSSPTLAMAGSVKARAPAVASVIRKSPDGSFDLMKEMFSDLRRKTGATVITASSGMEFVFAEERAEGDNGVFTYCLLDGLRTGSADADGDGSIHLSELQAYLLTKVPAMTGGRQRPTGRFLNQDADFVIATATPRPSFDAEEFVGGYLELTTRNGNEQEIASLFAPAVDYFGKSQTPGQIVQAEESYHQKFPQRAFSIVDDSIQIQETGAGRKRLNYRMRYDLSGLSGEAKGGNQDIELEVLLHEGYWKISVLRVLISRPDAIAPANPGARDSTTVQPMESSPSEGGITQFLKLSSENGQEDKFAGMFADSVDYFGKRFSRAQIYQDEIASHRNWPYRRLSLAGTVERTTVSPSEVVLRYTMSSWQSKTPDRGMTTKHPMEMHLRWIEGSWFISAIKVRKP